MNKRNLHRQWLVMAGLYALLVAVLLLPAPLHAADDNNDTDPAATDESGDERPNIVFILADDLGFSDIEPYGAVKIDTPHLQKLAEQGMRFTQMHNTSKCFPSRAVLLTGVYAQQNTMWDHDGDFNNAVSLGRVLGEAGYRTIAVGKHHSTESLYEMGFDHYYGLRDGASNYFNPGKQRASDPGKPAQKGTRGDSNWYRYYVFDDRTVKPFTPVDPNFYMTDNYTDWAIELMAEHEDEDKPMFLYLAYTAPHDPLQAWPEDIKKYEGKFDEGYAAIRKARYRRQLEMGLLDEAHFPLSEPTHRDWADLSNSEKKDQARRMEVYAAMIDRMDQNIGRLTDYLREQGELDNTIIMFASDNGASPESVQIGSGPIGSMTRWSSLQKDWANVGNTPFRYYKNWSYQGGICTPLIVRWPGVVKPGSRTNYFSHFIDIMPTLAAIADADYPEKHDGEKIVPMQGKSLLPVLKGETRERGGPIYWQWQDGKAVYRDGWKMVTDGGGPWRLFHLRQNRTETRDLSDEHPDHAARLKKQWQQWWESTAKYRKD